MREPSVSVAVLRVVVALIAPSAAFAAQGTAAKSAAEAKTTPAEQIAFHGPFDAGDLTAPPRNEASGLAASRRDPDLLWTHDDSGGDPVLFGVTTNGAARGRLRIGGVRNTDWEDLDAVTLDGKPWLVIADTGDNDAQRRSVLLHLVAEPAADALAPGREEIVAPWVTLTLRYEDGPRDAEAVAVDGAERAVYLLTKRDDVPRLYRAVLPTPLKTGNVEAHFLGLVPHLPKPTGFGKLLKGKLAQRSRPCGMDIAPDGSAAVVVTYGDVVVFPRRDREPWAEAMARAPIVLAPHGLVQAEAVCFSNDGTAIYVASESTRTLLRYDRN